MFFHILNIIYDKISTLFFDPKFVLQNLTKKKKIFIDQFQQVQITGNIKFVQV